MCGYYCFCTFQIYLAKETAHQQLLKQLPENLLTKIIVQDNKSIQWEEEGKEFKLNGEMYDVVKVKQENGKEYLLCLPDKKEDDIIAAIENIVKSNTNNSTDTRHHTVSKLNFPEWIYEAQNNNMHNCELAYLSKKYYGDTPALYFGFIEINSPPPDQFLITN